MSENYTHHFEKGDVVRHIKQKYRFEIVVSTEFYRLIGKGVI